MTSDLVTIIGTALRAWRTSHQANFTGLVHISVPDMQRLWDELESTDAAKYKRTPRKRKMGHGDQARIFGVRCLADMHVADGEYRLEG